MGFLDKIFIIEGDKPTVVDPSKPLKGQINENTTDFSVKSPLVSTPVFQSTAGTVVSGPNVTEEESKKYIEHFQKIFESTNDPVPSYHEFKDAAETMIELVSDKSRLYPKVLATFKGKLTKAILLQTANSTLNTIVADKNEFNSQVNAELQNTLGAKRKSIEAAKAEVQSLYAKIKEIEASINKKGNEIINAENAIAAEEDTIKQKAANYNYYADQLIAKLNGDIQDINTFVS